MLSRAASRLRVEPRLRELLAPCKHVARGVASTPSRPPPTAPELRNLFASIQNIVRNRRGGPKITNTQVDQFHATLYKLRTALITRDRAVALAALRALRTTDTIGFVTRRDWVDVAHFSLGTAEHALEPRLAAYNADQLADMELLAVAAAAGDGDATFALRRFMMLHLQRRQHQHVVDLYAQFFAEASAAHAGAQRAAQRAADARSSPARDTPAPASAALADEPEAPDYTPLLPQSTGLFDLQLCAMASYHALGAPRAALDVTLRAGTRFVPTAVAHIRKEAFGESRAGAEFAAFVERVRFVRAACRPAWLVTQIDAHFAMHELPELLALYDDVIGACRDAPNMGLPAPIALAPRVWAAFIGAFGRMNHLVAAQRAWSDMRRAGVAPCTDAWNAWLLAHAHSKAVPETIEVWNAMLDQRVPLDGASYCTMLQAYGRFGRIDDALALFRHLQMLDWKVPPPAGQDAHQVMLSAHNTLLDALVANGRETPRLYNDAEALLEQMHAAGPAPDIASYNVFLQQHALAGDVPGAATRLRTLAGHGLVPDDVTFTALLQGLIASGHERAAHTTLDLMRAFGVQATPYACAKMLARVLADCTARGVHQALALLDAMERTPRAKPNTKAYSVVLAGLARARELGEEETARVEADVHARIARARLNAAHLNYDHIVAACLEPAEEPTEAMRARGLRYYDEMVRHRRTPNNKTWMLVVSTLFYARRAPFEALEVLDAMRRCGVTTDARLRGLAEKVHAAVRDGYDERQRGEWLATQ